MEGGLCYFRANPDKASELGKRGGRAKGPNGTPGAAEYVARPIKSVDDVARLLADTINDLRSGRIDSLDATLTEDSYTFIPFRQRWFCLLPPWWETLSSMLYDLPMSCQLWRAVRESSEWGTGGRSAAPARV